MKTYAFALLSGLLVAAPCQAAVRISIDLAKQRLTATRGGGESVVWKISSGRPGFETPTGRYSVMRMEADHYSDEYDQAPMPYAIFFSPRGLAIHGSHERGLGSPRSHGCVRLSVGNAEKLFEWVEAQGGATIEIVGDTPAGRSRERARARRAPQAEPETPLEQVYRY
ncbi:MAG: L,D-transpeptidase [Methylocystis sp.]|uniref:L,D-transpeptidase n=1 Tax=Methylocystis sp. TaxID=1911079 RepID=UPI003DA211CA